jgi:hypothetical protein
MPPNMAITSGNQNPHRKHGTETPQLFLRVSQGRMHSVPAVEGQPVNNLIFGLAPGLEMHAMQAFNLQRAE